MLRELKNNPTLATGIFLPVVVIVFFALAQWLPALRRAGAAREAAGAGAATSRQVS